MKIISALLLMAMLGAFFVPLEFPVDTDYWRTLMDVSHLPFFALFTLLAFPFFAGLRWPHQRKCKFAFGIAALVSILVELIQPSFGRSQSMVDQVYGITGAMLGLVLLLLWPHRREGKAVAGMALLVLVFGGVVAGPVWRKHQVRQLRAGQFPVLGSFERVEETQLWRPNYFSYTGKGHYNLTTNFVSQGGFALAVDASVGGWPGVDFDAGDTSWIGFSDFAFDLFNPASNFILRLRIDDDGDCSTYARRYNHELLIEKGWNRIAIPVEDIRTGPTERELNLGAMRRVVLFISGTDGPRKFFLDNIRLTNNQTTE
jgi:hypothetical protein